MKYNDVLLTFVIPSYKETEEQMFPLLSSISNQLGIDNNKIEIIIVRDGTTEVNLDIFKILYLNIKQILMKENKGPGVARQVGLDAAQGKYVMFCDADDMIHNSGIIGAMIQEMEQQQWDILKTPWLEECLDSNTNQLIYINHEIENTWMHGKMFKKSFLDKNNIRFHPDLRVHEDTYFLSIATDYTDKIGYLNITSYVWRWGRDSITRHDEGIYTYEATPEFIRACCLAHEITEKVDISKMEYKTIQLIIYQYFSLHSLNWIQENKKEYRELAEQALIQYMKPYWKYWEKASPETIAKIYNEERNKNFNTQIEFETLGDWLIRLGFINPQGDNENGLQ